MKDSFGTNGYRYWGSLLNAETCRIGAPAYISFPHFFNADPDLLNYVEGLHPNAENHSFYIDINPV
ncbi:Scavenger receptor class B member 1 [Armadillidium nasatum]|uniref:Scavenger receptor class B member 1 n=1 Tax=Armadillidium nasatum TaxID=96803 RepID=A0A5N5SWI0_9CRUS|nr:Scavenger receptor class B member 1 [Armadillidium nasatum]